MSTLGIEFGALAPSLAQQMGVQSSLVKHEQADADAITRLKVRGYLSDGEARKARLRLLKRLADVARKGQ